MPIRRFFACFAAALSGVTLHAQRATLHAQDPPPVHREFRAAWVATVGNIDWPSRPNLDTWSQQAELLAILDKAVALHLNAIIFQIRPGTDALYDSRLEPWSEYLTGRQGRPPEPAWDPLAFAVAEAHKRGLELHAWFNPYRARYAKPLSDAARTHVSRTSPSLVRQYGSYLWMDPGDPAVRAEALRVVLDVVKRYDIDGVHIDDYFYPYSENDASGHPIDFPDSATYARYRKGGGTLSRDDWRRHNVDLLVESLNRGVHATKPWVRFGVSPIGIWRPGNPPSVMPGFDAYQEIFADTRKWLRNGWVDYWVPQLYWAIDSPQSYPVLLDWWASQNLKHRNLWIGNGLHRVTDSAQAQVGSRAGWRADEIVQQVNLTRASIGRAPNGGATGNVFFSMKGLMRDVDSIDAKLAPLYTEPALVPASAWLGGAIPPRPTATLIASSATGERYVRLTPAAGSKPWLWLVRTLQGGQWTMEILPNEVRLHRLGMSGSGEIEKVVVNVVDRIGNLSLVVVAREGRAAPSVAAQP
jgi:uncharacterized lipoprotein YddW (UPF0748 family)